MRPGSFRRRRVRGGAANRSSGPGLERLEPRLVLSASSAGAVRIDPGWFAAGIAEAVTASFAETPPAREWIVQFAPTAFADPAAAGRALAAAAPGVRVLRGLGAAGLVLVVDHSPADAPALAGLPQVLHVEPNGLVAAAAREPDDPRYQDGSLWGLSNRGLFGGLAGADIDAPTAWELSRGSEDVVVAVIDGGIDISHPDLAANAWRNPGELPGNGIDDDGNGLIDDVFGWDFRNGDGSVFDAGDNDHGTQVAGIIAARGDNGLGVVGVSWQSRIMPLKFIGGGGGSTADAISALNYTTMMRQRGVNLRVVNLSWGSGDSSWLLERAIAAAGAAGILVVASAGNSGLNQDIAWSPNYPASFATENILAVASTDHRDRLASDSNFGAARVHLAAPGVGILSTAPGRRYVAGSGTSFATPFVSGVAALAVSLSPSISVPVLRQAILSGVEPVGSLAGKLATGGRLNAARTLAVVIDGDPSYSGREYLSASAGQTLTDDRSRVGPRQLVVRGPGRVVLDGTNRHTGGTRIESGQLLLRNPFGLGSGGTVIESGAGLILDIGFATATIDGLALSGSAAVDLGTGGLVVLGGADEPTVREWILAGRTAASGSGIRSSAVTDASRTIGYAVTASGTATMVFTAPGDLDLDGDVDVLDLIRLQSAGRFGTGLPAGWSQGDVDYDGRADVFDLVSIAAAGAYGAGSIVPSGDSRMLFSQPAATDRSLPGRSGGESDLDLSGRGRAAGSRARGGAGIELGRIDAGAGLEIGGQAERFTAGGFQFQLGHPPLPASLLSLDDRHRGALRAAEVELELGDPVGFVRRSPHAAAAGDRLPERRGNPRIRFELLHRLDHERMFGQATASGADERDDDQQGN